MMEMIRMVLVVRVVFMIISFLCGCRDVILNRQLSKGCAKRTAGIENPAI
jgi:hypothetical protein